MSKTISVHPLNAGKVSNQRRREMSGRRRRTVVATTAAAVAGLLAHGRPANADPVNQIATWTGSVGNGSWSNASNWSPATVPVNNAQNIYNVIIPNGSNINYDEPVPTTINGISYGSGGSLTLGAGEQLTVSNVAALNSNITASGADTIFSADGPGVSMANDVQLTASAGAMIAVGPVSYTFDAQTIETAWSADGVGSVVSAPSLGTIMNIGSSYFNNCQPLFSATNGGDIILSGLQSLIGGSGGGGGQYGYAANFFLVGPGSNINLNGLKSVTQYNTFTIQCANYSFPSLETAGGSTFTLSVGTTVAAPVLTTVANWLSAFNIPNLATFNVPLLTTLNDSTISIAVGGTMDVPQLRVMQDTAISLQPGEAFNAPAPTNFDNSRVAVAGGSSFTIGAASYNYNRSTIETAWSADGSGSAINASTVTSMTNTGPSYFNNCQPTFSATNGGLINLSNLQTLVGGSGGGGGQYGYAGNFFVVGAGSLIDLSSLKTITLYNSFSIQCASYTFPSLQTAGGTTFSLAIGTTVSAPALTTVAGWSSAFNIPNFATFNAASLTTLNDSTVSIAVGGVMNVPDLQTMQDTSITLQPGETFNYSPPTNFNNSRVSVAGGSSFTIAASSYTYNRDAIETAWSANGTSSIINASSVQSFINNGSSYPYNSQPTFSATNGGTIDLSRVQLLVGGVSGVNYGGSAAISYFVANSGGTIRFGNLKTTQYNSFDVDGASATLNFKSLNLDAQSSLLATNLANVVFNGSFTYTTTTAANLDLDQGVVTFATNGRPTLEVAGTDLGTNTTGLGNFGMQQLNIGTATERTVLELVDQYHNSSGNSALYLLSVSGTGLRINDGSTLVLNGLDAYTLVNNQFINLNSLFSTGQNIVAYDGGFIARTMGSIPGGWKTDGNGNWSVASNWNLTVPTSAGDTAYFGPVITAPRTVTLDQPETAGYVGLEGSQEYTIAGSNTLTVSGSGGGNIEVVSGVHQITAPVYLAGDTQVAVDNPNDILRLSNVSSAAYATLTKIGAGTLNINPAGGTTELTVSVGTVNMIAAPAAGGGSFDTVTVSSGAKWNLVSYNQTINTLAGAGAIDLGFGQLTVTPGAAGSSYSGTITGSAGVENAGLNIAGVVNSTVPGSGILTLSGSASYQGDTSILSGGLTFAAANIAASSSAFTVATGAILNLNNNPESIGSLAGGGNLQLGTGTLTIGGNNASTTFSGTIIGTGGVTLSGAGNLTLSGSNPFTGQTTINSASLILANSLALENSTVQINVANGLNENGLTAIVGAISGNGALNISGASLTTGGNNATTTYGGVISGVGELIKTGSGTLYLRNANIYSGGTLVTAGTLDIDDDTRLGAVNTPINLSGGTLVWDTGNAWTNSRPMIISNGSSGTLVANSATIAMTAPISGAGTFIKAGNAEVILSVASTIGSVNVEAGQLELGISGSAGSGTLAVTNIPAGASVVLSKTTGATSTVLTNPVRLDPGAVGITMRVDLPFALALDGPLSGSADFLTGGGGASGTNVGTGTLVLAGNNSNYSGTITVASGTLSVQSPNALGSGAGGTRVSPGATLNFAGPLTYSVAEPLALAGTVSATGGAIAFPGAINLAGPATVNVDAVSSFSVSGVSGGFSLSKAGGGSLLITTANSTNGQVVVDGGSVIFEATEQLAALGISNATTVTVTGGGTGQRSMLYMPSLTDAGTLDLTGNDLDLQRGGSIGLSEISVLIAGGFDGGAWTGSGMISSTAANDSSHLTAVGVLLNATAAGTPIYTSLDGAVVALNDVLSKYTYYGDANLDGKIDGSDYSLIDNGYLNHLTGWYNGDFNYDGVVDGSDYTLIDNSYNSQGAQLTAEVASSATAIAAVPEPGLLAVGIIGCVGMLGRRRRVIQH